MGKKTLPKMDFFLRDFVVLQSSKYKVIYDHRDASFPLFVIILAPLERVQSRTGEYLWMADLSVVFNHLYFN